MTVGTGSEDRINQALRFTFTKFISPLGSCKACKGCGCSPPSVFCLSLSVTSSTDRWPANVEPAFGWLSVVRPLPWQSGSSIFSRAPSPFSGRTTESRPGYSQHHDVEPTEIGRRRALALAPPILVVRCASHLPTSVLCIRTWLTRGFPASGVVGRLLPCPRCNLSHLSHWCFFNVKFVSCDIAFVACDIA